MKADFKMSIDGEKVEVVVKSPGKKPKVVYSGNGAGAIYGAKNILVNEIDGLRKDITMGMREEAAKAAKAAALKAQKEAEAAALKAEKEAKAAAKKAAKKK